MKFFDKIISIIRGQSLPIVINISKDDDYHTQINNRRFPLSTCNTTSAIMALKACDITFRYPHNMQPEDYLTELLETEEAYTVMKRLAPWAYNSKGIPIYPPRQVHVCLAWGVNKFVGYTCDTFRTDATIEEMIWMLVNNRALLVNGKFTSSGHIVCVVGFVTMQQNILKITSPKDVILTSVTSMIIDDPYGNWHTAYKDQRGNNIYLKLTDFMYLTNKQRVNQKWMHTFRKL